MAVTHIITLVVTGVGTGFAGGLLGLGGAWRHHRRGVVYWKTAIIMGNCSLLAAFGGATLAAHLPGVAPKDSLWLRSQSSLVVSGCLSVDH